jgi:hypothetical protein
VAYLRLPDRLGRSQLSKPVARIDGLVGVVVTTSCALALAFRRRDWASRSHSIMARLELDEAWLSFKRRHVSGCYYDFFGVTTSIFITFDLVG